MTESRNRAVVIGASIAGLLTGRVLSDHFDEVVLLEKSSLSAGSGPRKAVPQGNHVHMILTPTYRALQQLLPGLVDDLVSNGASVFDAGTDARVLIFGKALANGQTSQPIIGSTRPFFEHHLRQRVGSIEGLEIRPNTRFANWIFDRDTKRIRGVVANNGGDEYAVSADLVVDARGRASSLGAELCDLGFEAPEVDTVGVQLTYTSRFFRINGTSPDWDLLFVPAYAPDMNQGGVISRVENDAWLVTQFGYFGDHAPIDDDGFLAFARQLEVPDLADFIASAEPLSDCRKYGVRDCRMSRYEKLREFPERMLAIGDTVCNLNPVYGQGMTKAAKEAIFLNTSLTQHMEATGTLDGFADRFRRELPAVGANWAWRLTTGADMGFRDAIGNRRTLDMLTAQFMKRLLLRAIHDVDARRQVFDATMLMIPPRSLLNPRTILHAIGF